MAPGEDFGLSGMTTTSGVFLTLLWWNDYSQSPGDPGESLLMAYTAVNGVPQTYLYDSPPSPLDAFGLPTGGNWIIAVAPPRPDPNPGDVNGDKQVDINDLTIVLTELRS